jgi:hypothetical protein
MSWKCWSFQSSPVPKDGCNGYGVSRVFNPCDWVRRRFDKYFVLFQSSPVPKDGCNAIVRETQITVPNRHRRVLCVSILTRPEGRVQPVAAAHPVPLAAQIRFQSSPVPKDGCNPMVLIPSALCRVSILTRPEGRVQPSYARISPKFEAVEFQSSPVPKDGCNYCRASAAARSGRSLVSILTRPEGRVQLEPVPKQFGVSGVWVSILTRPEGRVQRRASDVAGSMASGVFGFNPHPSRRTGATGQRVSAVLPVADVKFQSSPVPKDGCNFRHANLVPDILL